MRGDALWIALGGIRGSSDEFLERHAHIHVVDLASVV